MGKKRSLKSQTKESIETDSDIEEKVITSRRVLRSRVQSIENLKKNLTHRDHHKIDAYDADSEPENKNEELCNKIPELIIKSLEKSKFQRSPAKQKKIRNLKDFTVNLDDCCNSLDQESPIKVRSADLEKTPVCDGSPSSKNVHAFNVKDQENVTPPDVHTTPCLVKVVKNLDNSLFGFDSIEKKLDYSEISTECASVLMNATSSGNKSILRTYSRNSLSYESLGFDDIPVEEPKKRPKRKKKEKVADKQKEKEQWENLRKQFEEVEMHELIVE